MRFIRWTIKKIILFAIIILALIALFIYYKNKENTSSKYQTAAVESGAITQSVEETGTVKSSEEVNLNFLNSGRVDQILVKVGDTVAPGAIIALLNTESLELEKRQAAAALAAAQAELNKSVSGSTQEEIKVAEANVEKAKSAYESAVLELAKTQSTQDENIAQKESDLAKIEKNESSYNLALDNKKESALSALENKNSVGYSSLDDIKIILDDDDAGSVLSIKNIDYLNNTKSYRDSALLKYETAQADLAVAKNNESLAHIYQALNSGLDFLNTTLNALNNCFKALENSITTSNFTATDLSGYKTTINTDIASINTAISGVETARQNIEDAEQALADALIDAKEALNSQNNTSAEQITAAESKVDASKKVWDSAEKELEKILAGSNAYDIDAARAKVAQAQALLEQADKKIRDSSLASPIAGTITKINFEKGEYVSSAEIFASILGNSQFEIEVAISESDIAKLQTGNSALVDLDAFGQEQKFIAQVSSIDPAETVIQEVVYYKVTLQFLPDSEARKSALAAHIKDWADYQTYFEKIKSGMTANVDIITAEKENVLYIPFRAVIDKNGDGKFVKIINSKKMLEEIPVTLGLRGDDGLVEITSGLREGDEVVTYEEGN